MKMKKFTALLLLCVFPFSGSLLLAQSQEEKVKEVEKDIITLSEFEIEATEGKGYFVRHSITGLKTSKRLIDIPQSVRIITRDMIDDLSIKAGSSVETAKFVVPGLVPRNDYRYEVNFQRGFNSGRTLVDGFWDRGHNMMDKSIIDHIEVVKGPTQVLWSQRNSLAGMYSKQTKKALFTSKHWVRAFFFSEGGYRFEADSTGPIIKKPSAEGFGLAYRVVGAYENRDSVTAKEAKVFRDQKSIHATFTGSWGQKLTVSGYISYLDSFNKDNAPNDFIRKDATFPEGTGKLFIQNKGKFHPFQPDWSWDEMKIKMINVQTEYRLSDAWSIRTKWFRQRAFRQPNQIRNFKKDFVKDTLTFWNLDLDQLIWYDVAAIDVRGSANWGKLGHEMNLGFSWDSNDGSAYRYDVGQGKGGVDTVLPTVKLSDPDFTGFDNLPRSEKWLRTNRDRGTPGVRSDVYNYYYQHNLEVLEDKLFLVAGTAYSRIKKIGLGREEDDQADWVHRFGVVFKPIPGFALYFNNSTRFVPSSRRDEKGNLLPPNEGIVYEGGVKTELWNGRVNSTITYFDLSSRNIAVRLPDGSGYQPLGEQVNKGWEIDLGFEPVKNWQLIVTAYAGDIKDARSGEQLNNSINKTYSFMTAYNFTDGQLKGLRVGAAGYWAGKRYFRAGTSYPEWHTIAAFVRYKHKDWAFGVHIENLTDEYYAHGGYDPFNMVAPGPPRNYKFSIQRFF
jgi:iron complex outermembrane receptor protein